MMDMSKCRLALVFYMTFNELRFRRKFLIGDPLRISLKLHTQQAKSNQEALSYLAVKQRDSSRYVTMHAQQPRVSW